MRGQLLPVTVDLDGPARYAQEGLEQLTAYLAKHAAFRTYIDKQTCQPHTPHEVAEG